MNLTDSILTTLAKTDMYNEITPLNETQDDFVVTTQAINFVKLAKEYIYLFETDNARAILAKQDAENCIRIIEKKSHIEVRDIWQLHSEISCMIMNKYQKPLNKIS